MKAFHNCKEAVQYCISERSFSVSYLFSEEKTMDMHVHNCYELYYSISGGKKFLIGDRCYDVQPGDLFVINQYESHYLKQVDEMTHERIVLSIYPDFLERLSSADTDLTACFKLRSREKGNRLRLDKEVQGRLVYYVHKITGTAGYGADLITNAAFVELMVLINSQFQEFHATACESGYQYNKLVMDVIEYLNRQITAHLVLDEIAARFFISKSYLCRIFKKETGTTIGKYLIARRISIAKSLLVDGANVTEACERSGFNDYVNFVKSFTKIVGMSPKRYSICSAS